MSDSGETKDDVKAPEGDIGDKIIKLFREDEKETSMYVSLAFRRYSDNSRRHRPYLYGRGSCHRSQRGP